MKTEIKDVLGGLVVKNLPASAGDTGSIPGLGRSYMLWGNYQALTLQQEKPPRWEAHTLQPKRNPRSLQLKTQQSQK